ncbi:MAG TPA: hypothetical protein VNO23_18365, partial [Candidatus Binatia bacterium]|nr:hypothetical protein [Candidatus Binatia bacterium]
MTAVGLLLVPLVGAALLALGPARLAPAVHGATAVLTLALAAVVAGGVARIGPASALDGLLRIDGLSAWMVALIGLIAALAAAEAPRQVPFGTGGR